MSMIRLPSESTGRRDTDRLARHAQLPRWRHSESTTVGVGQGRNGAWDPTIPAYHVNELLTRERSLPALVRSVLFHDRGEPRDLCCPLRKVASDLVPWAHLMQLGLLIGAAGG